MTITEKKTYEVEMRIPSDKPLECAIIGFQVHAESHEDAAKIARSENPGYVLLSTELHQ